MASERSFYQQGNEKRATQAGLCSAIKNARRSWGAFVGNPLTGVGARDARIAIRPLCARSFTSMCGRLFHPFRIQKAPAGTRQSSEQTATYLYFSNHRTSSHQRVCLVHQKDLLQDVTRSAFIFSPTNQHGGKSAKSCEIFIYS